MSEDQKKQLEQQLWNIADTLRGKMDADEFRDYILGFIFYKYLSEKMEDYANDILAEDGVTYFEIAGTPDEDDYIDAIREEAIEKLGYFLKPEELFSEIAKRGTANSFILEELTSILRSIEQTTMGHESEDDFVHLFEDLDLTSTKLGKTVDARNKLIVQVLNHLNNINFELKNHDRDVLGDAYEYLIGQFAAGAGKKAGEFYTPQQVSKILAKLVTAGKTKLKSVYDPTCGSGSLLLRVAKEVNEVANFYGQELNRTTYNLARMNMIMHDVHYRKFDIKQDDTLEHPQHIDHRFEAIVANPPFSAKWSANDLFLSDDRFSQYGKLAPSSKADFAFVQHMIHHLDENGSMAIVLPHGVLFRGAAEGHIRKHLIEDKNYLDAVIGLPANIFYGTSIPTCVLVFKKCREDSDNVLFIDASNEFDKAKNQNYLTEDNVQKIIDTYTNREAIEKYSHLASIAEIKENDYNLNIPRYVDTFEEEEQVDLELVAESLASIESFDKENEEVILRYCEELSVPIPRGNNLSLLLNFKKGVQQKLFNQNLRFRYPGGTPYPDWQDKKLGELFKFMRGGVLSKADLVDQGRYKCIHYGELFTKYGEVIRSVVSSTNLEQGQMSKSGDILMPSSDVTPTGLATASALMIDGVVIGGDTNILRPKVLLDSTYFSYWLNFNKKSVIRLVTGTTVKHMYNKDLVLIDISLPCMEEQQRIAGFLMSLDTKISNITKDLIAPSHKPQTYTVAEQ